MTLLDKAKATPTKIKTVEIEKDKDERLNLAIAWLRDEITTTQVKAALEVTKTTNIGSSFVSVLK
jgi:hypothetical protein